MGGEASRSHSEGDDLHDLVEVCLKRIDQRSTSGRRTIVEFLASHGHPVSISDIGGSYPRSRGARPAPR